MSGSNCFDKEIKKNRIAEIILQEVLISIVDDKCSVEDVANNPEYYHYGDVRVTDKDGNSFYLDCKNDGVIHKTGNVFCETHKFFFRKPNERHTGFMEDGLYDYLCVVDRVSQIIYILDFSVLKKIHKNYQKVSTTLEDAYCYGNVISLDECKKKKALICKINYEEERGNYYALDVERY